jgi:hypothetical protein
VNGHQALEQRLDNDPLAVELTGQILDLQAMRWSVPAPASNCVTLDYAGTSYYTQPDRSLPGKIDHRFGGRGVYFDGPNGHLMEILTSPG